MSIWRLQDRLYDDFIRLFLCHTHREDSVLVNELSEDPDKFRFIRGVGFANLKDVVQRG
jgi:hypothetical protein